MNATRQRQSIVDRLIELAPIVLPFIFLPLALFLLLSAWSSQAASSQTGNSAFGDSVRHNIEAQTVHPNPQYEGTLTEGGVGLRSVTATRRYMTDNIRPLPSSSMDSAVGQQGGTSTGSGPRMEGQGK